MEEYENGFFIAFLSKDGKKIISKGYTLNKEDSIVFAKQYKTSFVHSFYGDIVFTNRCKVAYNKDKGEYTMAVPLTWYEIIITKIKNIWK